jgi:hypothetical protein
MDQRLATRGFTIFTIGDWAIGGRIYRVYIYNQGSRCLRRAVKVIGDWRLRVK